MQKFHDCQICHKKAQCHWDVCFVPENRCGGDHGEAGFADGKVDGGRGDAQANYSRRGRVEGAPAIFP